MDTTGRTVWLTADDARLRGELSVTPGVSALVILVTVAGGAGHTEREAEIASQLHRLGTGTLAVDLLATDGTPSRAARLDIDTLARRLRAVMEWLDNQERATSLPMGFCAVDTGAAAVLQILSTMDVSAEAAVFVDGRVDLGDRELDAIGLPVLFVVDAGNEHLGRLNRTVCGQLGTDREDRGILWAADDADVVHATTGWFESHVPRVGDEDAETPTRARSHEQ